MANKPKFREPSLSLSLGSCQFSDDGDRDAAADQENFIQFRSREIFAFEAANLS
jgi:hypothetical protein